MAKEVKSRYNFGVDPKTKDEIGCQYEDGTWCNLPKFKRCKHCMRCVDGSKACGVTAF